MRHLLVLTLLVAACASQEDPRAPTDTSIDEQLTEPHELMARADQLGLTDPQRASIVQETEATRGELAPLQLLLAQRTAELSHALGAVPIDEAAALAAAQELTNVEAQIKLVHLRLLIRLQNSLTPDQRARL